MPIFSKTSQFQANPEHVREYGSNNVQFPKGQTNQDPIRALRRVPPKSSALSGPAIASDCLLETLTKTLMFWPKIDRSSWGKKVTGLSVSASLRSWESRQDRSWGIKQDQVQINRKTSICNYGPMLSWHAKKWCWVCGRKNLVEFGHTEKGTNLTSVAVLWGIILQGALWRWMLQDIIHLKNWGKFLESGDVKSKQSVLWTTSYGPQYRIISNPSHHSVYKLLHILWIL